MLTGLNWTVFTGVIASRSCHGWEESVLSRCAWQPGRGPLMVESMHAGNNSIITWCK